MSPNYYEVLEVSRTCQTEDIKKAYRALALVRHPDKNPNDPKATANFQLLNEAHETLSDPSKRRKYDATLNRPRQNARQNGYNATGPRPKQNARQNGYNATRPAWNAPGQGFNTAPWSGRQDPNPTWYWPGHNPQASHAVWPPRRSSQSMPPYLNRLFEEIFRDMHRSEESPRKGTWGR